MPLTLFDTGAKDFLDEILTSLAPANAMRPEYHVGDYDLTDLVLEAEWGRPDDERPAQELTLRVKDSIDPEEIRNAHAYVYLNIADIRIRQFAGRVLGVTSGRARTEIRAVTGGYWLDKQRLPSVTSYANIAPSQVIYDCVSRMTRYDLAWMDLEEIEGPKMKATDEAIFDQRNKLADPIGEAVSSAKLFLTDSAYNAPVLVRDRSAAEATEILYEYVVGEDIDSEEFLPEVAGDEYYSVVAYRDVNGTAEELFDPILVSDSDAPVDAVYEIEVSDETPTAENDAYTLAVQAANRFAMGGATVSFSVDWIHPLMVDGDFISIKEPFVHGDVSGTRHWVAKVIRQRKTNEITQLFESVEMIRTSTTYDVPSVVSQLASELPVEPEPVVGRLSGVISSGGTYTGTVHVRVLLSGSLSAGGVYSGVVRGSLSGAMASGGTYAANLQVSRLLRGTLSAGGTYTGTLQEPAFSGAISGGGEYDGTLAAITDLFPAETLFPADSQFPAGS